MFFFFEYVIVWCIHGILNSNSNIFGDAMICVLVSCVVYSGFELRSYKNKDYKIGICCFSAKYAALMS